MTTKLTEAEMLALPCCRECGKRPTDIIFGKITCCNDKCSVGGMSPETWRLLMTPEAKGEEPNHYVECFGCGWQSSTMATNAEAVAAWMEHQRTCPRRHSLKNEIASLQSKLANSEERVKSANITLEYEVRKCDELSLETHSLKQQLAEATKPVGDEELEKKIKYLALNFYAKLIHDEKFKRDWITVYSAARQRKPNGDAIELAKWLKQESHGCSCDDCTKAAKLCDSILAQSAAGDSGLDKDKMVSTEGPVESMARVPAADFIADQPCHIDPTPQIGLGDGDCFINFDAKRILNDAAAPHEPEIRWTTPEETKDVERRRKSPKVIFSGIDATQYEFHKAERAVRAILGDFQLVLDSFTFLPRKEREPHADAYDSVPAADLLTAEARADVEVMRLYSSRPDLYLSLDRLKRLVVLFDCLAPAPSATTLTGEKP